MSFVRPWIWPLLLCYSATVEAAQYRLLDVEQFDFRAQRFGANRDPLTPEIPMDEYVGRVAIDFRLRLLGVFYWDNTVHSEGTESQMQTVGWRYELGLRVVHWMSVLWEHHSRHRMDERVGDRNFDGQQDRFPVEDSYGVRIHLITGTKGKGLFD